MRKDTKEHLLETGLDLLLEHGYNDLGVQALLSASDVPKGSFYHHFRSKQDFALAVVDRYMRQVHAGLDDCLNDTRRPPLDRVRRFFELSREKYGREGYRGCLLGNLGQELSAVNDAFRYKIEWCFGEITARLAVCLEEARLHGDLPKETDVHHMADLLLDCWEGAALRSRLRRDPAPLTAMLDFYFRTAA
ncbi:TetR family transcriptional regulator [Alkalispirillum mobile]|uniref:TetR family transcriptional regulator n=1 Tax=Alkalispirillum mobile TaxID=85925 RepID=A0A498C7Z9_9GAMM|nr:TetR/AcrR family transcriptional regulator [Alkalispirillum mobile]RLK51543.1 TetR family transcriptional regulator [Alkalispirillum mobile]